MKDRLDAIGVGLPELACKLISTVYPQAAVANCVTEFIVNVSNIIFVDKLSKILSDGNEDFFEWLKIAEDFDENNKNYQNAVRQLIYRINAINESELLNIYANLLRAYKAGGLRKDELYKLGWVLSNIFPDDLMYLKTCYGKKNMDECSELKRLEQCGLAYISESRTLVATGVQNLYTITDLGIKMLSCGIDYENHHKYQDGSKK